jgi:hypothetical protein
MVLVPTRCKTSMAGPLGVLSVGLVVATTSDGDVGKAEYVDGEAPGMRCQSLGVPTTLYLWWLLKMWDFIFIIFDLFV